MTDAEKAAAYDRIVEILLDVRALEEHTRRRCAKSPEILWHELLRVHSDGFDRIARLLRI